MTNDELREIANDFRRHAEACRLSAAAHFGPKHTRADSKRQAYEHCAELLEACLGVVDEWNATLRDRRIAAGFGMREFAERIFMLPSTYCGIENGRIGADADTRRRIESGLAARVDEPDIIASEGSEGDL